MKKTMNKGLAITLGVLGVIVFAMTIGGCGGRSHTEEPRPEEIRLSTPTNVRVDGGYLRWDTVEYANQYRVFINGGSPTTHLASVNYFNVSGLVHGTHRLAVAAVGFTHTDGRIFLDSYASSYITFNHTPPTEPGEPEPEKLGTPENLRIDGNYVRWNPVTNATGYDVTITRDKYEVKSGKVTTNYFYLNDLLGAGNEYMITVMAVDATGTYLSGTYVYITHNVPEETEPGEPEPEKLGTPENLRVDGNYVRWDAVTNATGYDVTITRDKYEVKSDKVTTNYFYLNDLLGAGNEYMITVMAVDATGTYLPGTYAYITHNVPNVYVPTLTAPTNVRIENGYLRWDAAAGATNARIYANGTMIATGTFTQYYADYLIDLLYSVAGHGAGETVTLTVVVSGYGYNESAQSEGFQFTIPTEYIPDPGPSPDDQYAADAVSNEISRLLGIIQYEKYNDMDINELEQLAQYVTSVKTAFGELTDVQQGLVTNWNNDNVTNLADLYTRVGERAGTKRTAATEFNTTIGEKRGLTAGDLDIAAARESRTTLGSLVSTFPTFTADQAALISNWDSYALDTLRNELTARIETLTTTAMQGVHTLTSRNGEAFTNGYLQIQITNNDIEFFANGYPIAGGTFKLYTESRNDAWIIMDVPAGEMTSLLGILGYGHDHITDVQIALSFDDTNIIAETTFNYNDTPSTHRYEFVAGGQLVEPTPKPDPDEEALEYVRGHYNALRGVYETADVTRAQLHAAHMTAYNALSALRPELRDQLTNVSEFLTGSSQPRINAMMRDKIQGVYTLTRRNGVDFAGDEKFQFRIEESVIAFYTNGTPIADGTIDIDWETVNWTIDAGQKTKLVNVLGYGHDHIENVQMGPFTITDDRELTTTMNFDYEGTPAVHTYEFQHGGLIYDPNVTLAAEIYAINEIIAGLGGHGDFAAEEFDNALQTIDSLKTRIAALPTTGNRDDLNMAGFNSARARAINTLFASAAGTTDYHQLYSYVNKIDARITDDADRELLVEHGMHPEHLDR
ncbi:MAG: hypothetical protein FWE38_05075, partial [Firmicutes bacterium]|nr:hypothetical protein [Bacillota bacterium]